MDDLCFSFLLEFQLLLLDDVLESDGYLLKAVEPDVDAEKHHKGESNKVGDDCRYRRRMRMEKVVASV